MTNRYLLSYITFGQSTLYNKINKWINKTFGIFSQTQQDGDFFSLSYKLSKVGFILRIL